MTVQPSAPVAVSRATLISAALLSGALGACAIGTQAGPPSYLDDPPDASTPTPTSTTTATAATRTPPAAPPTPVRPSPVLGKFVIHARPAQGTVSVERLDSPSSGGVPDAGALMDFSVSGLLAAAACPAGFQAATICFDASVANGFQRSLSHVFVQVTAVTDPATGLDLGNHAGINGDPSELGLDTAKGFWQLTAPASTTPGVVGQSPFNSASRQLVFASDDDAPADIQVRVLGSLAYSDYDFVSSSQPFVDACDGGVELAPSPAATLPLPFPFTLYGATSSTAQVGLAGVIALGDKHAVLSGHNLDLPSASAPGSAIFPFWDDLAYGTSGGAVCARTLGSAPNRQVVITWKNLDFLAPKDAGAHLTFSAMLSEGSDSIDVVYADMTGPTDRASGAWATFGVQDIGGYAATSVFHEAYFATGDAYSLIPAP